MKQLTAIAAIWLVTVLSVLADTVVTQDGQRHEGALTLQADGIQIGTTLVPLKDGDATRIRRKRESVYW